MAIAAQRFKSLTDDFNIPVISFNSLKANELLNAPITEFKNLLSDAKDIVGQIKGIEQNILSTAKNAVDEVSRITNNIYSTFTDLARLPETLIAGLIDDIFPNSTSSVKNLLKGMTQLCRNKALGSSFNIGGKLPNPTCSGMSIGSSSCPPGPALNLINQATLSAITQGEKLLDNLLKQIVTLGNIGFGANLCGVFAAITQGITSSSLLTASAGILLNQQGMSGNIQAVFDISKNLNDLPIVHDFPDTIKNIAENAIIPFGNFQNAALGMCDRVTGSLEAIDPNWNKNKDGLLSISNLGLKNEELTQFFSSSSKNQTLDITSLNTIQTAPDSAFLSSYALA